MGVKTYIFELWINIYLELINSFWFSFYLVRMENIDLTFLNDLQGLNNKLITLLSNFSTLFQLFRDNWTSIV